MRKIVLVIIALCTGEIHKVNIAGVIPLGSYPGVITQDNLPAFLSVLFYSLGIRYTNLFSRGKGEKKTVWVGFMILKKIY